MHEPTHRDTRVNLHVDVDDGRAYETMHIGFFPHAIVPRLVARLDAAGLAFRDENQTPLVRFVRS